MTKLAANVSLVIAFGQAVLLMLVAFGVHITSDQKETVISVTTTAVALLAIYFHPSAPAVKLARKK